MKHWFIKWGFVPQDCWIGVYWKKDPYALAPNYGRFDLWICLIPCLPIKITFLIKSCHGRGEGCDEWCN